MDSSSINALHDLSCTEHMTRGCKVTGNIKLDDGGYLLSSDKQNTIFHWVPVLPLTELDSPLLSVSLI